MTDSSPTPRFFALVPCAGTGSRAGADGPKQYRALAGRPMVLHTLAAFAAVARIRRCLVVVAPGDDFLQPPSAMFLVADCGGPTRAATVSSGLDRLLEEGARSDDWVLVHDAARCLVTPDQITSLMTACAHDPVGGLLAQPVADTLKRAEEGRVTGTLDRNDKWLAQTPQMFRIGLLRQALQQAGNAVTDEASAVESLGLRPVLVPSSAQNFKVTYPEDFALAEAVLRSRQP